MEGAQEPPRRGELHFLRSVESAFRRASFFNHQHGFLARGPNGESCDRTIKTRLARGQRVHEPEHARLLQIRKLPAGKFPVAARTHRYHLSSTPPRHPSAGWHLLLHVSFAVLYPRYLSRCSPTDAIVARFRSRSLLFPSIGRWTNCACRRFSPAISQTTTLAPRTISLGSALDDTRLVRKDCRRRHATFRIGRSHFWLRWPAHRARFVGRRPRLCRADIF